jgi:hypothetical protein
MKLSSIVFAGTLAFGAPGVVLSAQCSSRCGFLGLFTLQHSGDAGTNNCVEYCRFFPRPTGLQCGGCTVPGSIPASSPISIPIPAPTDQFAQKKKKTPVAAPVKLPVPAPVKLPVTVPVVPPAPPPMTAPIPVAVPAPIPPQSNFNIYLDMVGIPTGDQTFFTNAAAKWQSIILGDLEDISSVGLTAPDQGCTYPSVIDDLYICGSFGTIDGSYNVLGYAGPTYIRSSDRLTIAGHMKFDIVDINFMKSQNNFAPVILHEMGHVIGT